MGIRSTICFSDSMGWFGCVYNLFVLRTQGEEKYLLKAVLGGTFYDCMYLSLTDIMVT